VDEMQQLSSELVVLAARLVRDVRRSSVETLAASTRLMSLIDELGPSTVGVLAQSDRCSQPTMTGIVNGLAERGWVVRTPHPADSRANLVSLTAQGRRNLASVRRTNAALVARRSAASGRSADDLRTTVEVLRDLLSDRAREGTP
jgi:DNA-binding MarR family transcriptional regulator